MFHQGHPELDNLRAAHYQWLSETAQEEKAGEVRSDIIDFVCINNLNQFSQDIQQYKITFKTPYSVLFWLELLASKCFSLFDLVVALIRAFR